MCKSSPPYDHLFVSLAIHYSLSNKPVASGVTCCQCLSINLFTSLNAHTHTHNVCCVSCELAYSSFEQLCIRSQFFLLKYFEYGIVRRPFVRKKKKQSLAHLHFRACFLRRSQWPFPDHPALASPAVALPKQRDLKKKKRGWVKNIKIKKVGKVKTKHKKCWQKKKKKKKNNKTQQKNAAKKKKDCLSLFLTNK
jgi:hypothetical protein